MNHRHTHSCISLFWLPYRPSRHIPCPFLLKVLLQYSFAKRWSYLQRSEGISEETTTCDRHIQVDHYFYKPNHHFISKPSDLCSKSGYRELCPNVSKANITRMLKIIDNWCNIMIREAYADRFDYSEIDKYNHCYLALCSVVNSS